MKSLNNSSNREEAWWTSIDDKRHLVDKAKKYVGGQCVLCWDTVFQEQRAMM